MKSVILYNYFRSSTSYRVRIALNFKKIDYEYVAIHLLKDGGQQNTSDYQKLNPQKEVPVLKHGEKVIAQSMAIVEYLEEEFPSIALLPSDLYLKAKIRQFCENINSFIHPVNNLKVLQYLETKHQYGTNEKEAWIQHWTNIGLAALEKMIETNGPYCFGNEVTLADVFLIPQIFSAQRFKVNLEAFPKLLRINTNCLQLKEFNDAHPSQQPDFQN